MTVYTHRAERTDRLADQLAQVLATPLDDPFAAEVVAVPTPGVERWLAQSLSHRLGASVGPGSSHRGGDGVCAGISFAPVRRLVAEAVTAALGMAVDDDPWRVDQLTWSVLAELDAVGAEPWAAPVADYLGLRNTPATDYRRGRRWATARRLARLFHRYGVQRPGLIARWLAGDDVDTQGTPLPDDRLWQARLWRRLRARIAQPSPAERLDDACAALVADPALADLPGRVSVFGVTRLGPEDVRVLAALGVGRDVHVWLPQASPTQWDEVRTALGVAGAHLGPRRLDASAGAARHPLLAYLSRDARELQVSLAALAPSAIDVPDPQRHDRPDTLLGRLQAGLADDRLGNPAPLDERDTSVAIHAAHGPDRQVEVLRDLLVGMLADDPTLEPRDIIVMCPDIETFAPLITAAFGLSSAQVPGQPGLQPLGADHPGQLLQVRLADRSLRQVNPLLGIVAELLDLAQSRLPASRVLDLCANEPVMRKFGLTDTDLTRIGDLVVRSGVRWGLDAGHRAAFGMDGFAHNTWRMGLDRLLLGVTMDGEHGRYIGTVLPFDDVDSSDVDLLGRLSELMDRLGGLLDALTGAHPLPYWLAVVRDGLESLTAVPPDQQWQLAHAVAALDDLADGTGDSPLAEDEAPTVRLADLRALLADVLRGRPSRANFRTGTLTMCTMAPMRSVPHRVVCLLGVDDGVFPRRSTDDGDDLLGVDPWVGDHDARSEDRQLLLDAVMAAQERLVVIYSGADPRTNAPRPPAVPIGAVLDTLDRIAVGSNGKPAREALTTQHRLQPFEPENFIGAERSFDVAALAGARALTGPRLPPLRPWRTPEPLPEASKTEPVTVAGLQAFFNHPLRALLRQRAGLYLPDEDDRDGDAIPIAPDGLQRWAIADRMLTRRLRGDDPHDVVAAEWRRGTVPPRDLGGAIVHDMAARVEQVVSAAAPWVTTPQRKLEIDIDLPGGRVTGTLPRMHEDALVTVGMSYVAAKQRLRAWVELLAATVARPDTPWRAVILGKGSRSTLGPVGAGFAAAALDDLVTIYRHGMCEAMPFAANTSAAYARAARSGQEEPERLRQADKSWKFDHDELYERFFGRRLEDLTAERRREDEVRGHTDAPSRFGVLAWRVFFPMEQVAS